MAQGKATSSVGTTTAAQNHPQLQYRQQQVPKQQHTTTADDDGGDAPRLGGGGDVPQQYQLHDGGGLPVMHKDIYNSTNNYNSTIEEEEELSRVGGEGLLYF